MSSLGRPLAADTLLFDLTGEIDAARAGRAAPAAGRTARTLLKDGPLRVTLIVIEAGGTIARHSAEGPITIQPLGGSIVWHGDNGEHTVGPGQLLSAGPGVRHAISSTDGAVLLLTVALPHDDAG